MNFTVITAVLIVGIFGIATLWALFDERRAQRVRTAMLREGRNGALLAAVERDIWVARIFLMPFAGMTVCGVAAVIAQQVDEQIVRFIVRFTILVYLFVGAFQYTVVKWYLTKRMDLAIARKDGDINAELLSETKRRGLLDRVLRRFIRSYPDSDRDL